MTNILSEITALSQKDCFNIMERHKRAFTYPMHFHQECELNFVQHGAGVKRIVGDSVETIGEADLVLIGPGGLPHVWEQGECRSQDIREITVQFDPALLPASLLARTQFSGIAALLDKSSRGVAFTMDAIMAVYASLDRLSRMEDGFEQVVEMFRILNELSRSEYRVLSSDSFSRKNGEPRGGSLRIDKVKDYIASHYSEPLRLEQLASIAGMSPTAFSRFFRARTGKTLSSYITDFRVGSAARALVDTGQNVSEICYASGFNNLSNFNRMFKSCKGVSPKDFRKLYKKTKVVV